MGRGVSLFVLSAILVGCASSSPPLLPEDGGAAAASASTPSETEVDSLLAELDQGIEEAANVAPADVMEAAASEGNGSGPIFASMEARATAMSDLQRQAGAQALNAVNQIRLRNELQPLQYSPFLSAVAQAQVVELAEREVVSSMNKLGDGVGQRLEEAGYRPDVAGSLVAGGYQKFDQALASWLSNPNQRSRLLAADADEFGFSIITDRRSTYGTYMEVIVASD